MSIQFTRATRAQVPLKLGITGPSGSGKTTAALRLTRGLVGNSPIAFLDTENGSASLYADITPFDVINMIPPYQVAKFNATIQAAVDAGYKALIIDSASAEWQELLAEKEALDSRGGNSFANWGSITKKHEEFLKAIRNAPIHLILCLRAKQEHVQDKDGNGKTTIRKVGMAAIQREGMEYELTTVFDIAMDHNAKASKDRTGLYEGRLEPVTEATGRELAAWLASGKPLAENTGEAFQPAEPAPPAWSDEEKKDSFSVLGDLDECLVKAGFDDASPKYKATMDLYRGQVGTVPYDTWCNRIALACDRIEAAKPPVPKSALASVPPMPEENGTRSPEPTSADVIATFQEAAEANRKVLECEPATAKEPE